MAALFGLLTLAAACTAPTPTPTPTPTTTVVDPDLDPQTLDLMAKADRVVFLVSFSHWDTDWHDTFSAYAPMADQNILAAIQMAQKYPRFRYTLEQTLFVQHFWDSHPEARADLKKFVQNRQITFAWAGITQPETSLVAPAVQVRNLQLGQDWIMEMFGPQSVPHTAWQSDAFGNSAALPIFLAQNSIPYLFISRWQSRCDSEFINCVPLPHAFYWTTPIPPYTGAGAARVLAVAMPYAKAWGAIFRITDPAEQITALRQVVEDEFKRANSNLPPARYIILPMGFDFLDPLPYLPDLVERWNATDKRTVLVMAGAGTAFQYMATQKLPELTHDLNPIWQAFYGSRPYAKIADKEGEYLLTAADKFGLLASNDASNTIRNAAWYTATISAHYDNIGAVSYDSVWESAQRPRFEQTLAGAATALGTTLAQIAGGVPAPLVIFNPTSWPRSEVIEIHGVDFTPDIPDTATLPQPVQRLGPGSFAFQTGEIPGIGFAAPANTNSPVTHPVSVVPSGDQLSLSNGLVKVTLDSARGGTFSSMGLNNGPPLLSAPGDDVTYIDDGGDIYGAFFGPERARESQAAAQMKVLAAGPLLGRVQAVFTLGGQPLTKTITLRADSPLIEVALEIAALPETTAIVQTPLTLNAQTRTDDLGFAAFNHPIDNRPIISGSITYRREIFYPITTWGDVSTGNGGLTLITHGLQGLGGTGTLNLMLVRQVTDKDGEGVTDAEIHTLRYAYLPHAGTTTGALLSNVAQQAPWRAAYAFNQPLIPVWRAGDSINVQLPFQDVLLPRQFKIGPTTQTFPTSLRIAAAPQGLIADLYQRDNHVEAVVLDYDPATPPALLAAGKVITLTTLPLQVTPLELGN
ncbi:MAG: hypothetical protein HY326_05590 [Chloroflexi bacterium]|nr:hypothetical protein [Chloroflexota bacterium]